MKTSDPQPQRGVADRSVIIRCPGCGRGALFEDPPFLNVTGWSAADGGCTCLDCGLARAHTLTWPEDAYFQAQVAGVTLWAYNRDHLSVIRDYIAATDRRNDWTRDYRSPGMVRTLPAELIAAKNRERVLKAIDRLLGQD